MTRSRSAWLAAMTASQLAWFCLRSAFTGEPFDGSMVAILLSATAAGAIIALLPSGAAARAAERFEGRPRTALFGVAILGLMVGAVSSLLQPVPTLDEPFVVQAARSIADGGVDGLLRAYRENDWLAQRHPPLGPILFGLATAAGLDVRGLRFLSAVLLGAATALTAVVARSLGGDRTALTAGALLATCPLMARMGGLAMFDVLLTCLATAAVALVLRLARAERPGHGVALGLTLGLILLVKYTMVLLVPLLVAIAAARGRLRALARPLATSFLLAGALLAAWWVLLFAIGAAGAQVRWLAWSARAATGTLFGPWSVGEAVLAKLPSAIGLYHLPLLVLGSLELWRRGGAAARTIVAWIAAIAVPLLLTLPENRYFLPAFPAVAVLLALGLERLPSWRGEIALLALLLCLVTVAYYGSLEVRTPAHLVSFPP